MVFRPVVAGSAEHGDLDRRGLAGEDQHAVAGGVQGQVDEDVDPVGADPVGQLASLRPTVSCHSSARALSVRVCRSGRCTSV